MIRLQTTTPLFRAYEHAYNLLENTFLPLFHQSDDVSSHNDDVTKVMRHTQSSDVTFWDDDVSSKNCQQEVEYVASLEEVWRGKLPW